MKDGRIYNKAETKRANLLGIILCTCVGATAVMLTVKLGYVLFG